MIYNNNITPMALKSSGARARKRYKTKSSNSNSLDCESGILPTELPRSTVVDLLQERDV